MCDVNHLKQIHLEKFGTVCCCLNNHLSN